MMELILCTSTLLREIGDKALKQKDVAQTYAFAIKSSHQTDWRIVNDAIVERWSEAGLRRIKHLAWSGTAFREVSHDPGI